MASGQIQHEANCLQEFDHIWAGHKRRFFKSSHVLSHPFVFQYAPSSTSPLASVPVVVLAHVHVLLASPIAFILVILLVVHRARHVVCYAVFSLQDDSVKVAVIEQAENLHDFRLVSSLLSMVQTCFCEDHGLDDAGRLDNNGSRAITSIPIARDA
jgi:hypothetical protein